MAIEQRADGVRARRSAVARRQAAWSMAAVASGCGGAVVSEQGDDASPSGVVAKRGGSSSGGAAAGGASSSGTGNLADGAAGSGNGSAPSGSAGSDGSAGDEGSPGVTSTTIGTSRTCIASVSLADDGAETCSLTLSGSCRYLDYGLICACPPGECECDGPSKSISSQRSTTFVNFSTCPACPTAAQASSLCGFPY
jgi:hypothetical protein